MAYFTQEMKKERAAAVKAVLPLGWKATFGVRHHSTFVITIVEAPASVLDDAIRNENFQESRPYVNHFHLSNGWTGETLKALEAIRSAAMKGNYDNSDSMTDYFDVGYYLDLSFGKWDKPCKFV